MNKKKVYSIFKIKFIIITSFLASYLFSFGLVKITLLIGIFQIQIMNWCFHYRVLRAAQWGHHGKNIQFWNLQIM